MPYPKKLVSGVVVVFFILGAPAYGADSWWKRGLDAVRNIGEDTISSEGVKDSLSQLGTDDIAAGLKDALKVGSERVVEQLSVEGGFNLDPKIHIPLPGQLVNIKSALERVGMGGVLNDLELRLNQAAEAATPIAKNLFINAIGEMTLDDVNAIYRGADDAATQYFKSKMSPDLAEEMQPIIRNSLAEVGAIQIFDQVMGRYNELPFVPEVDADINNYVVEKAMDGIFYYLAEEEAAIRENPIERTTEILKKVFGAN